MIRVNERLKREQLRARLLLQVHDELLIEAPLEEVDQVQRILEEEMTHAADLKVKLKLTCIPETAGMKQNKRGWYK